jgi:hypothetical protein
MNNLNPVVLLVPVSALLVAVILYVHLLKKAANHRHFNLFILILIILSVLFNFAWEMLQMPLYKAMGNNIQSAVFCALAAVADAILILLLYVGFAFIYKNPFWIEGLQWKRVLLIMIIGGTGAILAEIRHLSAGNWAYTESMPVLPFVAVGIVPVLQFMIFPVVIFLCKSLSFKCC